ncbi:MAG: flavin reductase family protein, partial [Candidatus Hydrogenedentes bacterium]|nr:flavin reductase family protein [Candidatus Hydrogenedentota bacterium]
MSKQIWKPGSMLFPLPVVMVTSQDTEKRRTNICTVAWTGTVCTDPPMLSISLRKERHSHSLISASREFVVNVPAVPQVRMTDYCGVVSGRDVDKFKETGLTASPAS